MMWIIAISFYSKKCKSIDVFLPLIVIFNDGDGDIYIVIIIP